MGLETAVYTKDLNINNPTSTDSVTQGDDHLRLIKKVIVNSFPDIDKALPMRDFVEPSGVIKMWAGDITQIPDGYILCDSKRTINNTSGWYSTDVTQVSADVSTSAGILIPDLADRFILGAGETKGNNPTADGSEEVDVNVPNRQEGSEHWRKAESIPLKTHKHDSTAEFEGEDLDPHKHLSGTYDRSQWADEYGNIADSAENNAYSSAEHHQGRGGKRTYSQNVSAGKPEGTVTLDNADSPTDSTILDVKPRYYSLAYIIKD